MRRDFLFFGKHSLLQFHDTLRVGSGLIYCKKLADIYQYMCTEGIVKFLYLFRLWKDLPHENFAMTLSPKDWNPVM